MTIAIFIILIRLGIKENISHDSNSLYMGGLLWLESNDRLQHFAFACLNGIAHLSFFIKTRYPHIR